MLLHVYLQLGQKFMFVGLALFCWEDWPDEDFDGDFYLGFSMSGIWDWMAFRQREWN